MRSSGARSIQLFLNPGDMPYSPQLKALFIHIPKNAGKSVETAMGIVNASEQAKYAWRSPVNKLAKWLLDATGDRKSAARLFGMVDFPYAAQHMTYQEIELTGILAREALENSFKFAVVRNPWDRALSTYNHMSGGRNGFDFTAFEKFLERYFESPSRRHNDLAHKRRQVDFLRDIRGRISMDKILRFENLAEEYADLAASRGWETGKLPHLGKSREPATYRKFYRDHARELVSDYFREDIEHLHYEF